VAGILPTRIICVLRSRGRLAERSATSLPSHYAGAITARCMVAAMKLRGGMTKVSIQPPRPVSFG